MSFFYSDNSEPMQGSIPLSRINKNKQYAKHLENLLFLEFISKNTKDFREKHQAEKEIVIAKRKMAWWAKFPDFDQRQGQLDMAEIRKKWNQEIRGIKLK